MSFKSWFALWERMHRGADVYSLVLGGGSGLLVGCLLIPLIPMGAYEVNLWLERFISGQLPVWVISLFMLLRLGFLVQSDSADAGAVGVQRRQLGPHTLACMFAAFAGWTVCLPAAVAGYWFGLAANTGFADLNFIDDWLNATTVFSMLGGGIRVCVVAVLLGLGSWFEMAWLDARAKALKLHDPSQAIVLSVLMGFVLLLAVELGAFWLVY